MQSKLTGDEPGMCRYALQSGMLDEAHAVFCEHVAPYTVVTDDYDLLDEFGALFDRVSDKIPAWGPGGQLFTDFCQLKKRLNEVEDDQEMKEIVELARSVEQRLLTTPLINQMQRFVLFAYFCLFCLS
ncbi:unnamed protein product [Gongylonema pulchrum]|uniref:CTLH domain-containing protein n=1 Tax=Gongylonema pulchrum TaxID=637853 RepID=A0A183DFP5_9BILA|nr:unnamed protein product [Gongylonema pulchrum]